MVNIGYFDLVSFQLTILSARNLKPMDSSDSCNSYVKVFFLPKKMGKPKTKTVFDNRFPLFEKNFSFQLKEEQLNERNLLLLFSVRHQNRFGISNQIMAESLISLKTIQSGKASQQILLTLTRPYNMSQLKDLRIIENSDPLRTLKLRTFDNHAKNFLKALELKANKLQGANKKLTRYENSGKLRYIRGFLFVNPNLFKHLSIYK